MHDANPERIRSALSFLDPNDREQWVDMAFALKDELGEDGFEIWDDWGSQYTRPASEIKSTWKSAKPGGRLKAGTLFYRAKEAGWQDDAKYKKPSAAELDARRKAAEERAAAYQAEEAAAQEAAAERARAMWAAAQPAESHPYLERKGVPAFGLRVGDWVYEYADRHTGEILEATIKGCLLIPVQDPGRNIHSLQSIPADPNQKKLFVKDSAKRGHFFPIGKPLKNDAGQPVFILGEGYANCASVHAATSHMVLVCFDLSNLAHVARVLRERQPNAVIMFAADNDQGREDGSNPGVEAARKAASEVDGRVVIPVLSAAPEAPCDFNDLHHADGLDAVKAFIDAALLPPAPATPGPTAPPEPEPAPPPASPAMPAEDDPLCDLHATGHFTVLGYDGDYYFFFHHGKQQVLSRTKGDFSDIGLVELAPRQWWEMYYPAPKGGIDRIAAAEWIFALAHSRGIYDTKRVRSRGAWNDNGRLVFHHGGHLTIDGKDAELTSIKSGYVYPRGKDMPTLNQPQATDAEGDYLLDTARLVRWSMPGSAALMAGWVFLAPVCGALKWRPHIWITGAAGSGKSTIQSDYCQALVHGIGEHFNGGDSTAPGIRQALSSDAVPVLIDELEPNDDRDRQRISSILTMIRQSSSETMAKTAKGTVNGVGMNFHVRSMFCVASINTMLDKDSDSSRLTPLVIRRPVKGDENDRWSDLEERLHVIKKDGHWPARLLARSLALLPTIISSVDVFTKVAASHFGAQRHGDQFGTLLAGAWCLSNDKVPSEAEAAAMIASFNWAEHHEDGAPDDPLKALGAVLEAKIRVANTDVTVFELVADVSGQVASKVSLGDGVAVDTLNRHGMRIVGKELVFANSSPALRELVSKTAYFSDLKGQLLRVPGANKFGNKTLKFSGLGSKCVAVPLSFLFDNDEPPL